MRTYKRDRYTSAVKFRTVLSFPELEEANRTGTARFASAKRRGARDAAGFSGGLEGDLRGARCELAAAKILGLPWNVPYSDDFKKIHARADVGGYEIRSTALPEGKLVIREKDADDTPFILAVEQRQPMLHRDTVSIRLAGWAFASEAKISLHRWNPNDNRPAWFMPQWALRSMDCLPHLQEGEPTDPMAPEHPAKVCARDGCRDQPKPLSPWCDRHDTYANMMEAKK